MDAHVVSNEISITIHVYIQVCFLGGLYCYEKTILGGVFRHSIPLRITKMGTICRRNTVWVTNIGPTSQASHFSTKYIWVKSIFFEPRFKSYDTPYLGFTNKCPNSYFYCNHWCLTILQCPLGHRIWIWAQKNWFYLELLGQEVGPVSVIYMVHPPFNQWICLFGHITMWISFSEGSRYLSQNTK